MRGVGLFLLGLFIGWIASSAPELLSVQVAASIVTWTIMVLFVGFSISVAFPGDQTKDEGNDGE